jgi:mannonate dehydratase
MTGQPAPWGDRDAVRITAVRAIVTAPEGLPLVVVRVDTSDDGLYGLGCATFTQRFAAVATVVDQFVAPQVIGRHPADIEDLTRAVHYSSYWRDGPVLNNALSGLDMALWDIAGKRAGAPVFELLGGRVRAAAATYLHASGRRVEDTIENAAAIMARGWTHVRLQTGQPGLGTYGAPGVANGYPQAPYPDGWDVEHYLRTTPQLFERARSELGEEVELLHDVHSRLLPREAVLLARRLEQHRLFFLEDVIAPEHYDRLAEVRAASPVPIAVGELLSSMPAAVRMLEQHAVDYLRVHISAVGGLTPARKLTAMCELLGVKTAWHAPADVSPIGAAANVALDVSSHAFGIQEGHHFPEAVHEVFPGTLTAVAGYIAPSLAPGWGIDLDERAAARFPPPPPTAGRSAFTVRRPDGSLSAP